MDEERRGLPTTALGFNPRDWLKRHPLLVFFVLTFVLSLAVEIPLYVYKIPTLQLFVGWMPGLAALIVSHFGSGRLSLRPISDFPVVVDQPVVHSRYRGPLKTRRG